MELGSDQRQLHLTSSSNSSNSNISFFSTNQHQELFRHLIKAENIQEEAGKKRRQSKGGKEKRGNKRKKQKFIDDRDSFTTAPPIQLSQSKDLNMMEIPKLKPDWTPLPPLQLVEPEIKTNYSMCMPKGTGLVQSESTLEGALGNSSFKSLPDYYDLVFTKDPLSYLQPPTPPYSNPPSPKRERLDSIEEGSKISSTVAVSTAVKVPDSFPTPPHIGADGQDLESIQQRSLKSRDLAEGDIGVPSSPEPDHDSIIEDQLACERMLMIGTMGRSTEDTYEPIKYESGTDPLLTRTPSPLFGSFLNVEEEEGFTLEFKFKDMNLKALRKTVTALSRIIGTPITSYKHAQEDDDKVISDHNKKEHLKNEYNRIEASQGSSQSITNDDSKFSQQLLNHRSCHNCGRFVLGNGVRKPLCELEYPDHDIIYCHKQCFFENEFQKKNPHKSFSSPKKKCKASQIYHEHTKRIEISQLIEQQPELEISRSNRSNYANILTGADCDKGGVSPRLTTAEGKGRGRGRRKCSTNTDESKLQNKRLKGIKWKRWSSAAFVAKPNQKQSVDPDQLLSKYGVAIKPPSNLADTRSCTLCGCVGDGDTHGVARLLNVDVDQWVHLNCALWSYEVYEIQCGALINVDLAIQHGMNRVCSYCQKRGATIQCNRNRCASTYHCGCALHVGCRFMTDKTVLCPLHAGSSPASSLTPQEPLSSLAVFRKVYIQRQETKQIASIMQQGEFIQGERNYILRVGALMFHAIGQLSTHQMANFHSKTAILPVGYRATRIYWASNNTRKRCRYTCMITEKDNKPWFTTRFQAVQSRSKASEKTVYGEWVERSGDQLNDHWQGLLDQLSDVRKQNKMLKLFPKYINGESLFGLNSPVVCRILESLPNIELCSDYKFRYGRSPLLELPLAINPTGSARSEPHIKPTRKKAHTLISNLISECYDWTGIGESSIYVKHFFHSKSSQYRRMKQEWRNNVYLGRSRIQGLGLFASRDIDPGVMVIEYIGQIIRSEVAEKREKQYEASNRGVYMFRLDADYIVDATVCGGPARYINHSCNPNCVAEVVNFEKEKKIMIISNRQILKGEELNYDYKFDFEDEGNKIPCMCGAINCRKWMN